MIHPSANIARHLTLMAAARPPAPAIKVPRGRTAAGDIDYLVLSFAELSAEVDAWRSHLASRGIRRGDRALVMVRPGLPLIASAFALFQLGAVPVIIDPGMGLKSFLACVAGARPRALVGIPFAQFASRVFMGAFRSVSVRVSVRGGITGRVGRPTRSGRLPAVVESGPTELAAILFTSGSTGSPKGVCYEHGMFDAQVGMIRSAYGIEPGEVDLPMLPIFALFNPALGMTTIVPEIDPRRPAAADPAGIVQAIRQEDVANSFGSPTIWTRVCGYCQANGIKLPSLRRVLCAGAPVPAALWKTSRAWLTRGCLHSPYGATEALPVSSICADEIDAEEQRAGLRTTARDFSACVGRPLPEMGVKIIAIDEAAIATPAGARELPLGEVGEIIVCGPVVTKVYDGRPEATALAKINRETSGAPGENGGVWHRMGDCGFLDESGRLWFCGRKAERVETTHGTYFTEPCERVFRENPRVGRCALIGLGERGRQTAALVVEASPGGDAECRAFADELRGLARKHPHTAAIGTFYFRAELPVDVRHNAKIHRLALATWAITAKGFAPAD